jgi:hypothetical protein
VKAIAMFVKENRITRETERERERESSQREDGPQPLDFPAFVGSLPLPHLLGYVLF